MDRSYIRVSILQELLLVVMGVFASNEESYEVMIGFSRISTPKVDNYEKGYGSFLS